MQLLNLIYPQVCGICSEISKNAICNKCNLRLKSYINFKIDKYINTYFNRHIYFFEYTGIIREKILQYKFNENSYLYKFFMEIILNNCNFLDKYDIILAVPIHKKRMIQRGFNQSELIAKNIAKKVEVQYCNNILIKVYNNLPQSTLNKSDRKTNVLGMYKVINSQKIENKNILLIDDIYTTGSTLNECSKVLKQNGAENVDVLTIAKD